jgi:Asp-tRNA(Asn)/Glu-tRNA(Gln) amidotransferase A subunit family amidase
MTDDLLATVAAVRRGVRRAVDTVGEALERIERDDPGIGAFCALDADRALAAAADLDARIAAGADPGPLAGAPVGVKDLEAAAGFVTTFGDPAHAADPRQPSDSVEVGRLVAAGAIVVGKTNTPAYGFHAETDNLLFGPTRNPCAPHRTAGGSSGGSAAAVAAGLVPLCTGSDGGGSIRIPSEVCGIAGFKPTHGVVPNGDEAYGAWGAFSTRGPMAATFAEIALALDVVAGTSARDLLSFDLPGSFVDAAASPSLEGARLVWSPTLGFATPDSEVLAVCEAALKSLEAHGAVVVDTVDAVFDERPVVPWGVRAARGSWRTATAAGGRDTFGARFLPNALLSVDAGERVTDADALLDAEAGAHRAGLALARIWERADFLVTPGMATIPPRHREPSPYGPGWAADYTLAFNLARTPAAVTTAGTVRDEEGFDLPIGLQIVAPRCRDLALLSLATAAEQLLRA